jgi:hypothetical protein
MSGPPAGFNPAQSLLPDVPSASITPAMGGGGGATVDFLQKLIPKIKSKEIAFVSYKNKDGKVMPVSSLSKKTPASALVPLKMPPVATSSSAVASSAAVTPPPVLPVSSSAAASSAAVTPPPVSPISSSASTSVPSASVPVIPASLAQDPNFFERQEGAGCGRHALNNLFGAKYFTNENISIDPNTDPATLTPPLSLSALCTYLSAKYPKEPKMFICKSYEDYDTPVLMAALAIIHYPSERINDNALKQSPDYTYNETAQVIGYIINNGDIEDKEHQNMNHWVALRKTPGATTFRFINSMATGPDPTEFTSLSDYLTKRHRYPRFRAVIKVLERDENLNIGSILASVKTIQEAEAAKAAALEEIKKRIAARIDGFKELSPAIKGRYNKLSGFAESQEQLERLDKLLTYPQIETILQNYSGQLLEPESSSYAHFKLETFILLLTLILQKTDETNPTTHAFDDITNIDMIISFYYTATDKAQKELIYTLLVGEERDITLTKIQSDMTLKGVVDRLMTGKITNSPPPRFVFDNAANRTATFLSAFLNTSGAPPLTAVETVVQTGQSQPPALEQTTAASLTEYQSIPALSSNESNTDKITTKRNKLIRLIQNENNGIYYRDRPLMNTLIDALTATSSLSELQNFSEQYDNFVIFIKDVELFNSKQYSDIKGEINNLDNKDPQILNKITAILNKLPKEDTLGDNLAAQNTTYVPGRPINNKHSSPKNTTSILKTNGPKRPNGSRKKGRVQISSGPPQVAAVENSKLLQLDKIVLPANPRKYENSIIGDKKSNP